MSVTHLGPVSDGDLLVFIDGVIFYLCTAPVLVLLKVLTLAIDLIKAIYIKEKI